MATSAVADKANSYLVRLKMNTDKESAPKASVYAEL